MDGLADDADGLRRDSKPFQTEGEKRRTKSLSPALPDHHLPPSLSQPYIRTLGQTDISAIRYSRYSNQLLADFETLDILFLRVPSLSIVLLVLTMPKVISRAAISSSNDGTAPVTFPQALCPTFGSHLSAACSFLSRSSLLLLLLSSVVDLGSS